MPTHPRNKLQALRALAAAGIMVGALAGSTGAAAPPGPPSMSPSESTVPETSAGPTTDGASKVEAPPNSSEAHQNRTSVPSSVATPLEPFTPSESVSSGQAVSFPNDI